MRQSLQLILATVVVLVIGYVGYTLLFSDDDQVRVQVIAAQGQVTRAAADGGRSPLDVGDLLEIRDAVEVGIDSHAVLGVGEGTRLELDPASTVRLLEVDHTGLRVELEQGRVKARVRPGGVPLGLTSRGRAIYAEDADFAAAVDAAGALAVEPERGEVRVEGADDEPAKVPAGARLTALPGKKPVLEAVPSELLLEVGRPGQDLTRQADMLVEGRTGAYAEVRVGREGSWTNVRAGPDGRFRASVPLDEGDNTVVVEARDALGNTREDELRIIRDSTAPPITAGSEIQWGP